MSGMIRPPEGLVVRVVPGLWVATALIAVGGVVLTALAWGDLATADAYPTAATPVAAIVYATLGALIVRRVGNRIGWLLLGEGLGIALMCVTSSYAIVGLARYPGILPAPEVVGTFSEWMSGPLVFGLVFILIVFPTGTLPSTRWRPFAAVAIAVTALALVGFIVVSRQVALPAPGGVSLTFRNPLGIRSLGGGISNLLLGTIPSLAVLAAAFFVAAFVGLVVRYRSGGSELREQIKWVALAGGVAVACQVPLAIALVAAGPESAATTVFALASGLVVLFVIPVAITVAILKYRLYEIDVILNRAVVYGLLAAALTTVYVVVAVGIGSLVGYSGGPPLTIAAAAAVALLFQPLRRRAQRVANRIVYGERATPYQVLSDLAAEMAGTPDLDQVLERTVSVLAAGTGATRTEVWLRVLSELRPVAAWPGGASVPDPVPLGRGDDVPALPRTTHSVPVRYGGELLGAIALEKPRGEALSITEDKLLRDLASQAGLVLRNVRLTAQLKGNIEELRASRRRLVEAQDLERRRIERNLHDGAQQQLVALAVQLGLLERSADDSGRVKDVARRLQGSVQETIEDLRDLARGIFPPLLADKGLVVALEAQARRATVATTVEADAVVRYPREVEAAVYFCALEAMQNVSKYAEATSVIVRLSGTDGYLTFEIEDDGCGFELDRTVYGTGLQGMADRLDAIGGHLEVRTELGRGTVVHGRIRLP